MDEKMDIPSIHQELGKFVVLFQTMDSVVNEIIYQISDGKSYVAEAFITKTEFTAKMEIADVIFTHYVDITANTNSDSKNEFHSLMNRCKKIGQDRNIIVHSVYYPLTKIDGSKRLIQQNPRLRFKDGSEISVNDKELCLEDFENLNIKITSALNELEKFRIKIIDWKYPEQ
jgi:hypothetical protein